MGLKARDITELPIMETSKVRAGADIVDEIPVEWVSVIEGPVENFVRKNEFVLSTGIGCEENPEALKRFVQDIMQSGASVLGLATGRFVFNIPDPIIELAARHQFIIIEIPWEVRFGDILQDVLQKINQDKHIERQKGEIARKELINCVLQDKHIKDIIKVLYKHIGIPVAVVGESLQTQAHASFNSDILDAFTNGAEEEVFITDASDAFFAEHPVYHHMKQYSINQKNVFQLTIQNNNKQQGFVLFQPRAREQLTWFVMNVLEHALTAFALYFAKESAIEMTEIRLRDNFVLSLAKEHKELNSQVLSKAELLGYNLNYPYMCLVGTADFNDSKVEVSNDNPPNSSMQSINYYLQKEITNAGRQLNRKVMATFDEGEVIVFLEADQDRHSEIANQFLDMIERRLTELLTGIKVTWGIAKHQDGYYAFFESYDKARTALDIGVKQKGFGERTFFSDTRINRLLMSLSRDKEIEEIIKSTLQPLLDYDNKRQTDLLYTFMTYNKYKGNVSQTARALNLHRQSLLYRLRNIESLTNLSLVEADDLFLLELSVRLWMLNKQK